MCERLRIEPSITVNVDGAGATPEEAAAWVEYVNGPATSKYGAMRAANGHPAPYGVRQWELGNEIFGDWVRGHVTAEQYAEAALRYARAMRAVDPDIRLIAVGEGAFDTGSDAWDSTVLRIAGPSIQYLAVHDYTSVKKNASSPYPREAMMARAGEFERNFRHIGDLIHQFAPEHPIKLIVNEWNLFYDAATIQSMDGAVYASRMMNGFERDGDVVAANAISDLLNGWVGGIIQASRDRVYGTPQFYTVKMYGDHLGTDRLETTVASPTLDGGLEAVDAVATRTSDGAATFIKLSNADPLRTIPVTLDVQGAAALGEAKLELLAAVSRPAPGSTHPSAFVAGQGVNTFAAPRQVVPSPQAVHCARSCKFTLPPRSVAVLTLRGRGRAGTAR